MSGICVAESAEFFVIAGNEAWTRVNSATQVNQASIDAETQFGHGIRLVDVRWGKQLQSDRAEDFLCPDQDVACLLSPACNIKQPDENAFGTDANRIVEISCDTFAHKYRRNISTVDRGEDGGNCSRRRAASAELE
jgi:hypothetical protein